MIEGIEASLARLSGSRLVALGRAGDLQHFTFAAHGNRESSMRLHVSCPWRIVRTGSILAGSADYSRPASPETPDDAYDAGQIGSRLRDVRNEQIRLLLGSAGIEVVTAHGDTVGGLVIACGGDVRLEVFPDASSASHDEHEFWRLFEVGGPHVVVGSDGLDFVTDV